jgi:hypothetical protein
MFRGLGSTIAREMPGYFFFFGGYEATRGLLTPAGKTKDEIGIEPCISECIIFFFNHSEDEIETINYKRYQLNAQIYLLS